MTLQSPPNWLAADPRIGEILDIVAKETSIEREHLTPDASISLLGIASLDMVQAIFALEAHFNIEIPMSMAPEGGEFATVGDLVDKVLASFTHEPSL